MRPPIALQPFLLEEPLHIPLFKLVLASFVLHTKRGRAVAPRGLIAFRIIAPSEHRSFERHSRRIQRPTIENVAGLQPFNLVWSLSKAAL